MINEPVFQLFGRLLFPLNHNCFTGKTLSDLQLAYYSHIDPDTTVETVNSLYERRLQRETVFCDIYTDQEKEKNPSLNDTGPFFFKGNRNARFAICNAGGVFAYVAAIHDSFPHALELSEKGYNAFALIYRPDGYEACCDLARAIQFVFEHAEELETDTSCYSLWGGSAGARMAGRLGSYGTKVFGACALPKAGTVIMQYTGMSQYSSEDPPQRMPVSVTETELPAGIS